MATKQAHKRLTREYQNISNSPPEFIVAHPSESNILEWHYIITGPPKTPYEGGQYWGTLIFPPDYPFAPPAIRMHTPSGRFQPSTRLCLSISDFHPKSFNPAWSVSTILIGLLSFMSSDEMTTGSISATEPERRVYAARTRWWNSTGGGSIRKTLEGGTSTLHGDGNVKAGDGGAKFRKEWPDVDESNWKWLREQRIDTKSGKKIPSPEPERSSSCSPGADALRRRPFSVGSGGGGGDAGRGATAVGAAQQAREAGQSWIARHKLLLVVVVMLTYGITARIFGDGMTGI